MSGNDCAHDFTGWSSWEYAGAGKDTRQHACRKCTLVDEASRRHQHRFKTMPDPYAPVGSGAEVRYCPACGQP